MGGGGKAARRHQPVADGQAGSLQPVGARHSVLDGGRLQLGVQGGHRLLLLQLDELLGVGAHDLGGRSEERVGGWVKRWHDGTPEGMCAPRLQHAVCWAGLLQAVFMSLAAHQRLLLSGTVVAPTQRAWSHLLPGPVASKQGWDTLDWHALGLGQHPEHEGRSKQHPAGEAAGQVGKEQVAV